MLKYRDDYMPPAFLVTSADLNIDINDQQTTVTTKLAILPNPNVAAPTVLQLDGRSLRLKSVSVDGVKLKEGAFQLDDHSLKIKGLKGQHIVETVAECHPETNTALADRLFSRSSRRADNIYSSYRG